MLSHLSVRARNMRVLFAACHDPVALDEVASLAGKVVELRTTAAGAVTYTEAASSSLSAPGHGELLWLAAWGPPSALRCRLGRGHGRKLGAVPTTFAADGAGTAPRPRKALELSAPKWGGRWAVGMDAFANGIVGAKSKNLAGLRGRLPEWINLPPSCTMPFGAFEEVLKAPENREAATLLAAAVAKVTPSTAVQKLAECRAAAMRVVVPTEVQEALKMAMAAAGVPVPAAGAPTEAALHALRCVWASKYNDRAYVSTRKARRGGVGLVACTDSSPSRQQLVVFFPFLRSIQQAL